jgi:hypothetical protein
VLRAGAFLPRYELDHGQRHEQGRLLRHRADLWAGGPTTLIRVHGHNGPRGTEDYAESRRLCTLGIGLCRHSPSDSAAWRGPAESPGQDNRDRDIHVGRSGRGAGICECRPGMGRVEGGPGDTASRSGRERDVTPTVTAALGKGAAIRGHSPSEFRAGSR